MPDEQITVEIEKEAPPAETQVKTQEPAKQEPSGDAAVADLKSQFDTLKAESERDKADKAQAIARAAAAEAARQQAERERDQTRTQVTESRLDTVSQGIEAAKTEAEAAEAAYVAAQEAGDWKKAGAEQRKLARAEARIAQLEVAKADLEVAKAEPPRRQETQRPVDPTEAFIASRSGPVQAWLRAHMDDARILATGSDPRRMAKINAAHQDAMAEGIAEDSPQYFAHVEKFLGLTKQEPAAQQRRSTSAPVAPVQNGGGGMNGGGQTVTLTPGEARAATDGSLIWNYDDPSGQKRFKKGDPIGHQEMARRKLALKQQGAYDRMNYEQ